MVLAWTQNGKNSRFLEVKRQMRGLDTMERLRDSEIKVPLKSFFSTLFRANIWGRFDFQTPKSSIQ